MKIQFVRRSSKEWLVLLDGLSPVKLPGHISCSSSTHSQSQPLTALYLLVQVHLKEPQVGWCLPKTKSLSTHPSQLAVAFWCMPPFKLDALANISSHGFHGGEVQGPFPTDKAWGGSAWIVGQAPAIFTWGRGGGLGTSPCHLVPVWSASCGEEVGRARRGGEGRRGLCRQMGIDLCPLIAHSLQHDTSLLSLFASFAIHLVGRAADLIAGGL